MTEFRNVKITDVRFNVVGHTHSVSLDLCGDAFTIRINPSIKWWKEEGVDALGNKRFVEPWIVLLKIFDLEIEDGANLFNAKGKYCRLKLDGFDIIGIYHIVNDVGIYLEDLQK